MATIKIVIMKIFFVVVLFISLCSDLKSQTIHAFIFADTDDTHIGNSNKQNVLLMTRFFKILGKESKMNLVLQSFTSKEEFCKSNIKNAIDTLSCSWQDVIFFYYAGHGCRSVDDKSNFPQLCFNSKNEQDFISSEGIWSQLSSKGAHMCMVLCDASNVITSGISPKVSVTSNKNVYKVPLEVPSGISDLGLRLYAEVDIIGVSSSVGEDSWSDRNGGFFTQAFIDSYMKNWEQSTNLPYSWNMLCDSIIKSGILKSAHSKQKPIFKIVKM